MKSVRVTASFKGFLQLGNSEEYDTAVRIPVERYFRTHQAKPPTASQFVLSSGEENPESSATLDAPKLSQPKDSQSAEANDLTPVRLLRTYQIDDEKAPGGKIDVERDQLAKGYEYGRTAVHIDETDENITTLETFAGLELLGFIQAEKVRPPMSIVPFSR